MQITIRAPAWCIGILAFAGGVGGPAAIAQAPTAEQYVKQLECQAGQDCEAAPAVTETPAPPGGRKRGFNRPDETKKRSFRFEATTEQGRQEVEKRVDAGRLPSANVEVTFEFNSTVVSAQAQQALQPLGVALADPRLAGYRFVLVGHTDAKGTDAFNQRLSEQRAAAVRAYFVAKFAIAPDRLDTYGRGKSLLKNPAQPQAAENRRVQVINQGAVAANGR